LSDLILGPIALPMATSSVTLALITMCKEHMIISVTRISSNVLDPYILLTKHFYLNVSKVPEKLLLRFWHAKNLKVFTPSL
jgi:hypothetical protein